MQRIVEDPVEDDRAPVEADAGMIPAPREPFENQNETRVDTPPIPTMVHIMHQRQSTD